MVNNLNWLVVSAVVGICSLITLGIGLADDDECPNQAGGCTGNCDFGWKTGSEVFGSIECEHGPWFDSDCGVSPPYDCCELKPGGCTNAPGECRCFECNKSPACGPDFEFWICGCGKCKTAGGDPPANPGGPCDDCIPFGPNDADLTHQRNMVPANGEACDPGENFWMTRTFWCGDPHNQPIKAGNCQSIASICIPPPGWFWGVTRQGQQFKCKAKG